MYIFHINPRRLRTLNQTLLNIKEALTEWAEGFVGY